MQELLAEKQASNESLDLVAPGSMQLLPYYDDFTEAGAATRRWMFKTRDLEGAKVERQRAEKEDERAEVLRQLEKARNQEVPDQAVIAELTPELRTWKIILKIWVPSCNNGRMPSNSSSRQPLPVSCHLKPVNYVLRLLVIKNYH